MSIRSDYVSQNDVEAAADSWEDGNNLKIFKGHGTSAKELDDEWRDFESTMTPDNQLKSDDESIRLYGKTNLERYKELRSKYANESNTLNESEDVVIDNIDDKIEMAKKYMADNNTTIMYPTNTKEELINLWNKMNETVPTDEIIRNDTETLRLFGMTNTELYNKYLDKFNKQEEDNEYCKSRSNEYYATDRLKESLKCNNPKDIYVNYSELLESNTIQQSSYSIMNEAVNKIKSLLEYTPMASMNAIVGDNPLPMYLPNEFKYDNILSKDKDTVLKYNTIFDKMYSGEVLGNINDVQNEWYNDIVKIQNSYKKLKESYVSIDDSNDELYRNTIFAMGWHPDYDITEVSNWRELNNNTLKRVSEVYNYNDKTIIDINEFVKSLNPNSRIPDKALKHIPSGSNVVHVKDKNPIYVVLRGNKKDKLSSEIIKWYTAGPYSHATIATSCKFDKLYSFNRDGSDGTNNHKGLSIESLDYFSSDDYIYAFCVFVNDDDFKKFNANLNYYVSNKSKTHYSTLNIVTLAINKPLNLQFDMICSQFVDRLLKFINVNVTSKDSSVVSPNDLWRASIGNKKIYKVYEGQIKDYNYEKTKLAVQKLIYSNKTKTFNEFVNMLLEKGYNVLNSKNMTYILEVMSARDRKQLPKSVFGIPDERKYPLIDAQHVTSAIRLFGHCPESKRHMLAKRIEKAAEKFNVEISDTSLVRKYLSSSIAEEFLSNICAECINESKHFPVQFTDDGDLLIKTYKKMDYNAEYQKSHEMIKTYDKSNSIEGIKYELARLWFINTVLTAKIHSNKINEEDKKEYTKIRSWVMNDFTTYNKKIIKIEPDFNFSTYYESTPFSDVYIKIDKNTMNGLIALLKSIIKL